MNTHSPYCKHCFGNYEVVIEPHEYPVYESDEESEEDFWSEEEDIVYVSDHDDEGYDELLDAWNRLAWDMERERLNEPIQIQEWYDKKISCKTFLFDEERMQKAPFDYLEDEELNRFFLYINDEMFKDLIRNFPLENVNLEFSWKTADGYIQSRYIENFGPKETPAKETIQIELSSSSEIEFYKDVSYGLANGYVTNPIIYSRDFINIIKDLFEQIREEKIDSIYEYDYFPTEIKNRKKKKERRISNLITC